MDGTVIMTSLQQLNHMVIVEELKQRLCDATFWYINYVQKLEQEEKGRVVLFTFVDGKCGAMTCLEILFHIINHGTYHRGAISHALDLADVPHPADT